MYNQLGLGKNRTHKKEKQRNKGDQGKTRKQHNSKTRRGGEKKRQKQKSEKMASTKWFPLGRSRIAPPKERAASHRQRHSTSAAHTLLPTLSLQLSHTRTHTSPRVFFSVSSFFLFHTSPEVFPQIRHSSISPSNLSLSNEPTLGAFCLLFPSFVWLLSSYFVWSFLF